MRAVVDSLGHWIFCIVKEVYEAFLVLGVLAPLCVLYCLVAVIGIKSKSFEGIINKLCKHLNEVDGW